MQKCTALFLIFFLLMLLAAPVAAQQSGTYTDPPAPPAATGPSFPDTSQLTPPTPPLPPVPSGWIRIPMLDINELSLSLGQAPVIITATTPTGYQSGTVAWSSSNTSVITVVANSPARVTPVGPGTAHAIVTLEHEGTTYYDSCYVRVLSADALATPPTGGNSQPLYIIACLTLLATLAMARPHKTEG